jgi:hypothetical protein
MENILQKKARKTLESSALVTELYTTKMMKNFQKLSAISQATR